MILFLGNGFIANALSERLRNYDLEHRIISKDIVENPPETFKGDISLIEKDQSVLQDVDTVFYFAHSSVPYSSMQNVLEDAKQNILTAVNLFKIFAEKNIRVIYISSGGSVYGNHHDVITEETLPSPISAYGVSKYTIENYLKFFHHNFNLSYDILRVSNIYGVGQKNSKPQGIVSAMIQAFLNKSKFKIWGDGKAKKDYLYIDDLAEAFLKVVNDAPSNDTYNISKGDSLNVSEIVSMLESIFKYSIEFEYIPAYSFDVQSVFLNNDKFVRKYNWHPQTDFTSGIKKTIEWLKDQNEKQPVNE